MKTPKFTINPNFRLTHKNLSVSWHLVDQYVLQSEADMPCNDKWSFGTKKGGIEIIALYHECQLDFIYCNETRFDNRRCQHWLKGTVKSLIYRRANEVLPARVKYWEDIKGLHGNGAKVEKLKSNWFACCTHDNIVKMQAFLVIMKQKWTDGVILHEMAHYKYKHHRKSFWKFLSTLIGEDSELAKVKDDIAIAPYYQYYLYLTR